MSERIEPIMREAQQAIDAAGSTSALEDVRIRYLGRKAGISKRVHPHLFRHSLATELLRRGVNPIQVRDILGHTSLAMIDRVYSHLTTTDASKALLAGLMARDEDE
jgi:site-specific recombinase XerD